MKKSEVFEEIAGRKIESCTEEYLNRFYEVVYIFMKFWRFSLWFQVLMY